MRPNEMRRDKIKYDSFNKIKIDKMIKVKIKRDKT